MHHMFRLTLVALIPALCSTTHARTCLDFDTPSRSGKIDRDAISESSGLAVSRDYVDTFWTHNDSGDDARFFAVSSDGEDLGTVRLTAATATDWEAMSIGPCGAQTCLFIGDVGDNNAQRQGITVWRVPEPVPPGTDKETIVLGESIEARYPEGAMDCEAIAYDPITGDILLVEKSWSAKARVHRLPASAWETQGASELTLDYVGTIDFDTDSLTGGLVTGADIAPSGFSLFARTYVAGFHITLERGESGTITGFGAINQDDVYGDGQCEAIAFNQDGMQLWFTCEDENGPIGKADCTGGDSRKIQVSNLAR